MRKYVDFVEGTDSRAVSGASVYVTTYPGNVAATLYSDDAGTPQANPVTTDNTGEYSFYVVNGHYNIQISGAGLVTKTIADVVIFDPSDVLNSETAAATSATAAGTSATAAAGSSTAAAGSAAAAAGSATAAASSATEAAASETAAAGSQAQAVAAAATAGVYPNSAASAVPRQIVQSGVGAITGGAGGTNGTFNAAFSAGTGWLIYPTATFTVSGGAVTAFTITSGGLCISASFAVPTVSFAASTGLTGAAVALTSSVIIPSGSGYWVTSADGFQLDRYKNVSGVATSDTANVASLYTASALNTSLHDGVYRLSAAVSNLYNVATATQDQLPKKADGTLGASVSNYSTDYIPVVPGQSLVCNYQSVSNVTFGGPVYYDALKRFVSAGAAFTAGTAFTVPAGAAFMRVGFDSTTSKKQSIYIGVGTSLPLAFGSVGFADTLSVKKAITQGLGEHLGDAGVLNLFDPASIDSTGPVNATTGVVSANAGFFTTGFMPVVPGGQIVSSAAVTMASPFGVAFYDIGKTYISGVVGPISAASPVTVPGNAAYARYGFQTSLTPKTSLMIVQGSSVPSSYKGYGTTDLNAVLSAARGAVRDYLPPDISIYDRRRVTAGFVLSNSDVSSANASYSVSDYMPVIPGGSVVTNLTQTNLGPTFGINFYDHSKTFISSASGGGLTAGTPVSVPSTAFYARTTVHNSQLTAWALYNASSVPAGASTAPSQGADDLIAVVKRWKGKNFGVAGDSITASASGFWASPCAGYLGATLALNTAVSGQGMQAITSTQITSAAQLTNIDVFVVFAGTNDFGGNTALGAYSDTSSASTFFGYTRKAIETILGFKPTIRLALFTPTPRSNQSTPNSVGKTLVDYVNAIKAVCPDYSVPVLDLYSVSGLNSFNFSTYTSDGLHPNSTGGDICIAKPARAFLDTL